MGIIQYINNNKISCSSGSIAIIITILQATFMVFNIHCEWTVLYIVSNGSHNSSGSFSTANPDSVPDSVHCASLQSCDQRQAERAVCARAVCFTSQISQLWEFSFPSRKPTGLISARHKTGHCTSFEMRIYNTSLHLTTWNMKQINYYRPELNSQRSMYHVLLRCICFHAEITDYFLTWNNVKQREQRETWNRSIITDLSWTLSAVCIMSCSDASVFMQKLQIIFSFLKKKKCCHRLWCGEVSNLYSDDWRQRYSFKTEKNKNSPMEVGYSSLKIAESV